MFVFLFVIWVEVVCLIDWFGVCIKAEVGFWNEIVIILFDLIYF
jgi:hypothetical protein